LRRNLRTKYSFKKILEGLYKAHIEIAKGSIQGDSILQPGLYKMQKNIIKLQKGWENSRKERIISQMKLIMGRDFPIQKNIV